MNVDIDNEPEINGSQVEHIIKVARENNYKSYLEIGVQHGGTLLNIQVPHRVGVDPAITSLYVDNKIHYDEYYSILNNGAKPDIVYYPMTSDDYFSSSQYHETFDMIFVDGMHEKEQAMRDIVNSLEHLNPGGAIAVHDTLPRDKEATNMELGIKRFWTGNVFKTIIELRVNEPYLEIWTLSIPNGLTFIRPTKEPQPLLDKKYLDYEYDDFDKERAFILNIK